MKTPHKFLLKIILIMTLPILLSEYLFRTEVVSVVVWLINHPFMFVLNLTVLVGLTLFFVFLFRRPDISVWFVLMFSIVIGVVNGNKFSLRSVPFMLNDFFLFRELWVLLPEFFSLRWVLLAGLTLPLAVAGFFLMRKWFGAVAFKDIKKTVALSLVLCFAVIMIGNGIYAESHSPWELGFIYSLPRSVGNQEVVSPVGWDRIEEQLSPEEERAEDREEMEGIKKQDPNVIIIMSESFWDVKELDVEYSQNPIAYFDGLKEESIHGDIYVPVFGGGTANSEFEVLTGLSLKNYPNDWHMVYREEIDYPLPSLASVFREAGYQTRAMHPYHSWYYQRDTVYPLLGFQQTTFKEDLEGAETLGPFISDYEVTDYLIEQLQSTEDPLFSFTVTMQNHGPYNEKRNPPVIDFETELDQEHEEMLQIFTDGTYHSDQALKELVEFLRDWEEPTLLLFFSDHLPMLGDNYSIYRDLGLIGDETPEELQDNLNLYTVPYVLWSNYSRESVEKPVMNASFLAPLILDKAQREKPIHLEAVSSLQQRAPLITNSYLKDGEGNRYDRETETYREVLDVYGNIRDQLVFEAKHLRGLPGSQREIIRKRQ